MDIYNDFIVPLPMIELIYDLPDESLNMYSNSSVFAVPARSKVSISRESILQNTWANGKSGISKVKIYDMFRAYAYDHGLLQKRKLPHAVACYKAPE